MYILCFYRDSAGSGSESEEGTDPDEIGSDMDTSSKQKKERKPKRDKKSSGSSSRKVKYQKK